MIKAKTPEEALSRALLKLSRQDPFFSTLAFYLNPHLVKNTAIYMAATNGETIFINSDAFVKMDLKKQVGLIMHEVMHVAFEHIFRRGDRDFALWNIACDYVINGMILEAGGDLPEGGCTKKEYEGLIEEEVYARLPKNSSKKYAQKLYDLFESDILDKSFSIDASKDPGSKGKSKDSGKDDSKDSDSSNDSASNNTNDNDDSGSKEESSKDNQKPSTGYKSLPYNLSDQAKRMRVRSLIVQAAHVARSIGSLPAGISRYLDSLLQPAEDWRLLLAEYLLSLKKSDFDWTYPSRRSSVLGLVLPGLRPNPVLDHIAVVVDTSCSISDKELAYFISEILGILEQCYPRFLTVLPCDTEVHNPLIFEEIPDSGVVLEALTKEGAIQGGGGTNMHAALDWIEETKISDYNPPTVALVMTDGETPFGEPTSFPVLWCITQKEIVSPWGHTIFLSHLEE
jgi:predicted metal-dependent peptidase